MADLLDATVGTAFATAVIGTVGAGLDLSVTWPAHGWLLALAVVGQVVGWTLIASALPRLPATSVSVLILAQPMLSVLCCGCSSTRHCRWSRPPAWSSCWRRWWR
jgi:drug/metabolite transporter (DMT)-like permease